MVLRRRLQRHLVGVIGSSRLRLSADSTAFVCSRIVRGRTLVKLTQNAAPSEQRSGQITIRRTADHGPGPPKLPGNRAAREHVGRRPDLERDAEIESKARASRGHQWLRAAEHRFEGSRAAQRDGRSRSDLAMRARQPSTYSRCRASARSTSNRSRTSARRSRRSARSIPRRGSDRSRRAPASVRSTTRSNRRRRGCASRACVGADMIDPRAEIEPEVEAAGPDGRRAVRLDRVQIASTSERPTMPSVSPGVNANAALLRRRRRRFLDE